MRPTLGPEAEMREQIDRNYGRRGGWLRQLIYEGALFSAGWADR